jgi:hypothetical protein
MLLGVILTYVILLSVIPLSSILQNVILLSGISAQQLFSDYHSAKKSFCYV